MNEIAILNYIIERLKKTKNTDCVSAAEKIDVLIAELETARKALGAVPTYCTDDIVNSIFGEETDNAE